eukprot:CAMPEP_0184559304 /NCGR_PEP_ID=MMETSP0199_2-20130426/46359_1 /TAXON_ID=1112570 /ORGANISM="Thraustochytrium sp., Strain LLF1b" /LENGTH=1234 /DNA_ID=CAMNT_0026956591 /DNA_START=1 /DNA_END=3705 /DNA_ORIENTATION=+
MTQSGANSDGSVYRRPSEALESVIDVDAEPAFLTDPTEHWALVLRYKALSRTIEDISKPLIRTAGLSFDPELRVPEKTMFAASMTVQRIFKGEFAAENFEGPQQETEITISGLENYIGFRYFEWDPSGKRFLFCGKILENGVPKLHLLLATMKQESKSSKVTVHAKPVVTDRILNAITHRPASFIGDGSHILCYFGTEDLLLESEVQTPRGPNIKENLSTKKAPARTYQRLIASEKDEDLFEKYVQAEVGVLSLHVTEVPGENERGEEEDLTVRYHALSNGPELVHSFSVSPDRRHALVTLIERPYSWALPYSKFPTRVEVWNLSRALSANPPPTIHEKVFSGHPALPDRGEVEAIPFSTPMPDYSPVSYVSGSVLENDCTKKEGGWADPVFEQLSPETLDSRLSYHNKIFVDENGFPLNPVGRTGMTNRGLLGKWGPNHAADAIVTRYYNGKLQVVAIQRKDNNLWALPGGMVDAGESVSMATRREFREEAGNLDLNETETKQYHDALDKVFSDGKPIYKGYVDDPRNTDNAWMESTFTLFHCDEKLGGALRLGAGDDAGAVKWLDVDEENLHFGNFYASHKAMVLRAKELLEKGRDSEAIAPVSVSLRTKVINRPSHEGVPISFDSTVAFPRGFRWHWIHPCTLCFKQALDEGDPKHEPDAHGYRDSLWFLSSPFTLPEQGTSLSTCENAKRVFSVKYRIGSVLWTRAALGLGIVRESWYKTRRTRSWTVKPSCDQAAFTSTVLFDRSSEDAYGSPGSVDLAEDTNGHYSITQSPPNENGEIFFTFLGAGASPVGSRPFYDRLYVKNSSGEPTFRKERVWRCALAPDADTTSLDVADEPNAAFPPEDKRRAVFEQPIHVSSSGHWLLLQRESNDEPRNLYWYHISTGKEWQITNFAHPQKALIGVQAELVKYKREDGVELNGKLYLPKGYVPERDGPRPCLLWAYPREFKGLKTAGQIKTSPYRFTATSWSQPITWVVKGWVILGFSAPIVAEGDEEPNDSFVEQVQQNARAAVDMLKARGIGRTGGFAVGGHSYGAFMTGHLLAHTNLFNAGIARSGAYLRALTPFGFQAEERSFWETPETYMKLSPFAHAPKIAKGRGKMLLIHGTHDENSGTFPLQSERLYDALKGHGGICRLVLLPNEGHGYAARESILHVLAEQESWLERWVEQVFDDPQNMCEEEDAPRVSNPDSSTRTVDQVLSRTGLDNVRTLQFLSLGLGLTLGVVLLRSAKL